MPERDPGPSVKDPELYERLREEGESKEKAARIANQAAREGRSAVGARGGHAENYEVARPRSYASARRRSSRATPTCLRTS
jgi:hypothetical protein